MPDFELRLTRRARGTRRRGISGLGLLLVVLGLLALLVAYSALPSWVFRAWPLVLVGVGGFGALRRPGWVEELDVRYGPQLAQGLDRPRRLFSLVLIGAGLLFLPFTTGLVDARLIGPAVLIALGLLLVWRRAR